MTAIATPPKMQFVDSNGKPLVGGKLYTYAAGTTTPLATYTDYAGGTPNANPIILNSRGEADVWLGTAQYKFKLTTSTNVEVWTVDNLNGADPSTLAALAASGGSALVGYLPAGTGAVATTVQTKLRESVSVFDFMTSAQVADVKANTALLDVTAAINNALNSGAKNIFFPAGSYKTTATVTKPMGVLLMGEGSYSSIIVAAHNNSIIKIGSVTFAGDTFNSIESLGLTNAATFNSAIGLECLSVNQLGLRKLRITNGPVVGIRFINVLNSQIDEVTVTNCSDVGIYLYSSGLAVGTNTCTFSKINNSYCAKGVVIDCNGGLLNTFNDLVVEGTTSYPIQISNGQQITFNGLYLEGNAFSVKLLGGTDITFRDIQNVSNIQFIESAPVSTNVLVERLYSPGAIPMVVSPNVTTFNNKAIENITGVRFAATAAPSTDPNTLDDYREGTWTPTDASGAGLSLTVASATYTRIGRMVFATLDITYPTTANGAIIQIGGLPFNSAGRSPLCIAYCTTATILRGSTDAANNVIYLSNSTGVAQVNSVMSGQTIRGTVVYYV